MVRSRYCGALAAVLALPLLSGCAATPAGSATAGTPGMPPPATAATADATPGPASAGATPTAATPASDSGTGVAGCADGPARIPSGSRTTQVNDIDGDGRADTAFFTTTTPYEFGFATAAGGVYTTPDRHSPTGQHHAWTVNTDGFPGHAVVIDDGLEATVLAFRSCGFHPLTTADGSPLTIAIGARNASGDATTGIACNDRNGGILLEAAQARLRGDGRYDIAWSTLEPAGTASGATFSRPEIRFANLPSTDHRVQQARTSSCWAARTLTVSR